MANEDLSKEGSNGDIVDGRHDDVIDNATVPTVVVVPADEDSTREGLNEPLVPASENGRKDANVAETLSNGLHANWVCGDSAKLKPTSATFSSGDLYRRDMLSSPTSSRIALGFGSLDIIMDNDNRSRECISPDKDPYERPEKWGWAVVFASWIVMIPVAGVLASFGTIVKPLTQEFNATKLEAGWIGSLAFSFTVGTCPFSTPLFTVFGARKVALVGVLGATISLIVTSFAPVLYLLFLTYSALFGTFANFIYNTAMNLTGQYFPYKHQALATCLASAGVSFGTLLINPASRALVECVGWRHTLKILAGGIFVIGLGCVAVFRPVKTREQKIHTKIRHHKEKKGHKNETISEALVHAKVGSLEQVDIEALTESIQNMPTESRMSLAAQEIKKTIFNKKAFDCSVCSNPAFMLWMLGTLLWSVSFLFPFIFLIDYMSTIGIPAPVAAWVLTAYGIAEFSGRIICAFGAGKIRFSLAYVYAGSACFVGLATILAPFGKSLAIMYIYAVCAGLSSGILNSLMYVATMQFFGNDVGRHVWGYINVMLATGMVVGPVAAGGIFDATQSYETAFYMGGSVFIVGAVVMAWIPFALSKYSNVEKKAKTKREKPISAKINGESKRPMKNGSSIVKPGALRRLAHQQSALREKVTKKPKFNNDVENHLRELHEIEEELKNESQRNGKHTSFNIQEDVTNSL